MAFGVPIAAAQDASDEPVENIVVTGSRIARDPNLGAAVPVQSVTGEDIQLAGQTDLGEVLNDLPALLTSTSNVNSGTGVFGSGSGETAGAAEVGETILQLRGLGIERTLVLVNGRRHVAGVGGSQAVDIGSIPSQLIERVEVLTGGASAIYGADAVTGVVNFIMRDDFDGLSIDVQGGIAGEGDGEEFSVSALYGLNFADDRGNVTVSVNASNRAAIKLGDRDFSRNNGIASDDPHPDRRFQIGDISTGATPNFDRYYNPANQRVPVGLSIPDEADFLADYADAFPGDPAPALTEAERALITRAQNSPVRAILPQHNFALTSAGGVINVGSLNDPGIDLDGNGLSDCLQSWEGYNATYSYPDGFGFIGGCWIIDNETGVARPHRDGIIADVDNQWGLDGGPDDYDQDDLIPEEQKFSINVLGHYDLTNSTSFFWEAKWARQENEYQNITNTFWDLLTVAPDNPYINQLPGPLAAVGQAEGLFITRDPTDLGPNIDKGTRNTVRFVAGLEGEFDNGWEWEVAANYGRFNLDFEDRNRVVVDRWLAAIDAVDDGNGNVICRSDIDPTPPPSTPFNIPRFNELGFFTFNPGDGQCRPANILGGPGAISQDAIDFVTDTVNNTFETEQFVMSATVVGEWGETNAGPIGFAAGAELRTERSQSTFDPLVRGVLPVTTDFGTEGQTLAEIYADTRSQRSLVFDPGAFTRNVRGNYDVGDIFAEVNVPLLEGQTFAEELTVDAAVRFSNYSTVGNTLTWKVGSSWAPTEDLRFRGAYSVAVRAPNIDELFSPEQSAFFRPEDPCEQTQIDALIDAGDPRGQVRAANCAAAGIPAGFVDPLTARFVGATVGNPDLTEEEAETITLGFVYQPNWVEGLSLTVDYWDIVIEDAIDEPSDQDIVNNCYDSSEFPNNQFCALIRRNTDPTSAQFGGLTFLQQQQLNIGKLEATGVDFAARYDWPIDALDVSTTVSGTYMDKLDEFFDPGDPTAVDPELGELQRPELAGSIALNVGRDQWALNWQTQYMDEQALRDVEIETVQQQYGPAGISDEIYIHNLNFSWDFNDSYRVYGGVNNLSDEEPFITERAFPVNPIGRFFFVGLNVNLN